MNYDLAFTVGDWLSEESSKLLAGFLIQNEHLSTLYILPLTTPTLGRPKAQAEMKFGRETSREKGRPNESHFALSSAVGKSQGHSCGGWR